MREKDKRDVEDVVEQQIVYVGVPERSLRRRERDRSQGLGCIGTIRLMTILPVLVLVVVIGCMAAVVLFEFAGFMRDPLDNFLGIFGIDPNAEPEVVDSIVIIKEITALAQLELYETVTDVHLEVVNTGAAPDASLGVVFRDSVVKAGIDLSHMTVDAIEVGPDNHLTITLPPVYLTSCNLGQPDYNINCTNIPLIQNCGPIIDRMQDEAYRRGTDDLREAAYELGLKPLAEAEAESVLYALLESLGYTNVTFFHSAGEYPDDRTCFPNPE